MGAVNRVIDPIRTRSGRYIGLIRLCLRVGPADPWIMLAEYANLDFLFAVFEEKGLTRIYYRGRIVDDAPAAVDVRYVALNSIPWDRIRDPAVGAMLRRYVKERTEDAFGIYMGDVEKGTVQALGGLICSTDGFNRHQNRITAFIVGRLLDCD